MKLYQASLSPSGRRLAIFLAEKGVTLDTQEIDLRAAENLSEEFRRRNPFGRIPVLELDDGTHLAETVAICRYFEHQVPEPNLFGRGAREEATIEMWNRRAELNFLLPVAMAFRNRSGYFKDREQCVPEWGEVCAKTAASAIGLFDQHLATHEYLAGERNSIADITLGVAVQFAERTRCELPDDLPHLARWLGAVTARPAFALPTKAGAVS